MEELGSGVRTLTPEDAQAREVQNEKRQTRDDVSTVDLTSQLVLALHAVTSQNYVTSKVGVATASTHLQRERLVGVELDEKHWSDVSTTHSNALVVQTTVVERTNEIAHTLAFHADVRSEDVIANLQECFTVKYIYLHN